jgi:hypothetical protein
MKAEDSNEIDKINELCINSSFQIKPLKHLSNEKQEALSLFLFPNTLDLGLGSTVTKHFAKRNSFCSQKTDKIKKNHFSEALYMNKIITPPYRSPVLVNAHSYSKNIRQIKQKILPKPKINEEEIINFSEEMTDDINILPASTNSLEYIEKTKQRFPLIKSDCLRIFDTVCQICKEDYLLNDEINQISCDHLFHTHCLIEWLKIRNTCPVCRFEFPVYD